MYPMMASIDRDQVFEREDARYEQYMSNVVTVLTRATHMLAVPPCKTLDPRVRSREIPTHRTHMEQHGMMWGLAPLRFDVVKRECRVAWVSSAALFGG